MTDAPSSVNNASAESRLFQLIERLLKTAEDAATLPDWAKARSVAEDVLTVDPDNDRALAIIRSAQQSSVPSGQRALMTILFSDLVDSTPLADEAEPEVVRDMFRRYREVAADAIDRYGGVINNYMGDGIMAVFGFPTGHEDDASRAVSAAVDLIEGMKAVDAAVRREYDQRAKVRVGIHTGLVLVSDLGPGISVERDAIVGVAPNLAARIQSEAEPGMVAISDVSRQLVEGEFAAQSMGFRQLKGISRPVELFSVDHRHGPDGRLESERYRRTELVGRDALIGRLTDGWRAALAGQEPVTPTVLIGATGLGKSRVVAHVRNQALAAAAEVIEIGCLPYYSTSPLWPLAETLRRKLDLTGGSDNGHAPDDVGQLVAFCDRSGIEAAAGVPLLASLLGAEAGPDYPAPPLDPIAARLRLLETLSQWLSSANGSARLLIIEDFHWADPSTEDLIGLITAQLSPGVQVLVTSREPVASDWAGNVTTETLEPLSDAAARDLTIRFAGGADLDDDIVSVIVDRGEGIPLFLEELARTAAASGATELVPVRLQGLLTARLNAPGIDLEVAQVAATFGLTFSESDLIAVLERASMSDAVDGLIAAEMIQPVHAAGHGHYRFRQTLLRDAAYETQVLDQRRSVHTRVAGHLIEIGGDAAVVAQHFDEAGEVAEATAYYLTAAQAAHNRGANEEAQRLSSRGLELLQTADDAESLAFTELGLRMMRAVSVSSVYGYAAPTVEGDLRQAIVICEDHGTVGELIPTSIALWSFMLTAGDLTTSGRLIRSVREKIDQGIAPQFDGEVSSCEGWQAFFQGELPLAQERLDAAIADFDLRPPNEIVSAIWPLPNDPVAVSAIGLAAVLTLQGEFGSAKDWEERAMDRARSEPFPRGPFSHCFVATYVAWLRSVVGDTDGAQTYGASVTDIATEHGYLYWSALGALWQHIADLDQVRQGLQLQSGVGQKAFLGAYLAVKAELEAAEDVDQAARTIEEALSAVEGTGERLHLPRLLRQQGQLLAEAEGSSHQAAERLRSALHVAREQRNAIESLRATVALSGLDQEFRPPDWANMLQRAIADFAEGTDWVELRDAEDVLRSAI